MANPVKVVQAGVRVVAGILGKGSKTVNPVYKNGGAAPISNVKVKPQGLRGMNQEAVDMTKIKIQNMNRSK